MLFKLIIYVYKKFWERPMFSLANFSCNSFMTENKRNKESRKKLDEDASRLNMKGANADKVEFFFF